MIDRSRVRTSRPRWAVAAAGALVVSACAGDGTDTVPSLPDAVYQDVTRDAAPDESAIVETTAPPPTAAPTSVPPGSTTIVPGVFADDNGTELGVGVLMSWSGFGQQSLPIGVAVGKANEDVSADGLPFGAGGDFTAPLVLADDGGLTEDPEVLRAALVDLLDGTTDLVIGAVPPGLVEEFTVLADDANTPLVVSNHVHDGTSPTRGSRIDIAGSLAAQLDVMTDQVVLGEYAGLAVVGVAGDPTVGALIERLDRAGAVAAELTVPTATPVADELATLVAELGAVGDGVAVVLASPGVSAPVIDAAIGADLDASFFAGDVSLSPSEAATLDGLRPGQLVVVRRVDDLRRPEQQEFAARLVDFDTGSEGTFSSAESFDAYVLAALAVAEIGRGEGATLADGMIAASRDGEPCTEVAECFAYISDGLDIDYDGWSGPIELDDDGVATHTWFGVQTVDPDTGGVADETFVLRTP